VRIREAIPLGNTGKGIWATDAEGEDCLEIASLDGQDDLRRIGHGQLGRVLALAANPEGSEVAVASHDGAVFVVNVAGNTVRNVGRSRQGEATGLAFSPGGRYLVWRETVGNEGALGRLVGHDLTEDRPFELTRGQFNDFSPTFSFDGRYLYFLSSRTIDPAYDEINFDLGFTNTVRPYVIPLSAEDPVPFGPSADGWAISEAKKPEAETKDEKPDADVVLDVEGAEDRMVPLPVPAGRYDGLCVTAEGVLWRRLTPHTGVLGTGQLPGQEMKDSIEAYDVTKRKLTVVVDACDDAAVSGDGKQLVVRNGDDLWVQPADARAEDEDRIAVNLNRLRRQLLPRDEWRQMFDENARLMRDHYWREDMNGIDWDAVCASYRPLLERITTHDDLVDVLVETNAELNTSHAYVTPTGGHGEAKVAWLGADLGRNEKGEVVINRILDGESSDPKARSPLRAAGVAARAGDVIVAVDGKPTAGVPDINALLLGAAGAAVELTLARGDSKRRVVVVPVANEAGLRYHEWVASRVERTKERSRGRVGYVHVPNMMAEGWAEFHRLIEQASRCEAVVVDVRYNSGGHTSSLVLERLTRTVVGWDYARHMGITGTVSGTRHARTGGVHHQPLRGIRRRHHHRRRPEPRSRPRGGGAQLGRCDRDRRAIRVGRRHQRDPAPLRLRLPQARFRGGEPRNRSRHRGSPGAVRLGELRRSATRRRGRRSPGPPGGETRDDTPGTAPGGLPRLNRHPEGVIAASPAMTPFRVDFRRRGSPPAPPRRSGTPRRSSTPPRP